MSSIHQAHVSEYHKAVAGAHHGGHNMHLFHRDWHTANRDPARPTKPDAAWGANLSFGSAFLEMHHEMVKATSAEPHQHMQHASIVQWYGDNGIATPSQWDPATPIPQDLGYEPDADEFPKEIKDELVKRAAPNPPETLLKRKTNAPNLRLPLWFTRAGVPTGAAGEPITGARKLADFVNANQLGCCIVFPHNSWHNAVGGAMLSTWTAIADPIFYFGVHWIIDAVFDEYKWIEGEPGPDAMAALKAAPEAAAPAFELSKSRNLPEAFSAEMDAEIDEWVRLSESLQLPPGKR